MFAGAVFEKNLQGGTGGGHCHTASRGHQLSGGVADVGTSFIKACEVNTVEPPRTF